MPCGIVPGECLIHGFTSPNTSKPSGDDSQRWGPRSSLRSIEHLDHDAISRRCAIGRSRAVRGREKAYESIPSRGRSNRCLQLRVFPFLASARLEEGFTPLVARLQHELDHPIRYRSTRDYGRFMELLGQGLFDLAYVQPFDYVRIAVPNGYRALARRGGVLFASVVVPPHSAVKTLGDLRGKTLGLPPEVAAVTYVSRGLLRQAGLDRAVEMKHFRTHDSCLQQLLVSNVDACAVGDSAVAGFEIRMDVQLRRIARSPSIPPSLIVGHHRLGEQRLKQIRAILHDMEQTLATRQILGLGQDQALISATDSDYDPVREIWTRLTAEPTP